MIVAAALVLSSLIPPPSGSPNTRFPSRTTHPMEVAQAELSALRAADLPEAYRLLSRARRLAIDEAARRDVREFHLKPELAHAALGEILKRDAPGLLGHASSEIVASLGDPEPPSGLLPKWTFRVRVDGFRHYMLTLTRQSEFDGGDPRDKDGNERCWLVWQIKADSDGGSKVEAPPELIGV